MQTVTCPLLRRDAPTKTARLHSRRVLLTRLGSARLAFIYTCSGRDIITLFSKHVYFYSLLKIRRLYSATSNERTLRCLRIIVDHSRPEPVTFMTTLIIAGTQLAFCYRLVFRFIDTYNYHKDFRSEILTRDQTLACSIRTQSDALWDRNEGVRLGMVVQFCSVRLCRKRGNVWELFTIWVLYLA